MPSVIQLFSCRLRPSTPCHNKCAHVFPAVQNLGRPYWLTLSPMYLWMLVFFTRPHKEERFLFPIYPLVCLSGAVALSSLQVCPQKVVAAVGFPADPECLCLKPSVHLQKCYHFLFQRYRLEHYTVSSNWLALSAVMAFTVLSLSRSVALFRGRQQGFQVLDSNNWHQQFLVGLFIFNFLHFEHINNNKTIELKKQRQAKSVRNRQQNSTR